MYLNLAFVWVMPFFLAQTSSVSAANVFPAVLQYLWLHMYHIIVSQQFTLHACIPLFLSDPPFISAYIRMSQ